MAEGIDIVDKIEEKCRLEVQNVAGMVTFDCGILVHSDNGMISLSKLTGVSALSAADI